jgi:hypothetical protein
MMKLISLFLAVVLLACNGNVSSTETSGIDSDSTLQVERKKIDSSSTTKKHSNTRFRNVTVRDSGENTYIIEGEGQIFEANFGWVVEDGHNELKEGFQMTDAGAPEWGKFKFTVEVEKQQPNSTLTLILFETSAKDGSRQHELPIVLE